MNQNETSLHFISQINLAQPLKLEIWNINHRSNKQTDLLTCKNVLPSSRNSLNGTSPSTGFLNSAHPIGVRNCAPDTAQIGVFIPVKNKTNNWRLEMFDFSQMIISLPKKLTKRMIPLNVFMSQSTRLKWLIETQSACLCETYWTRSASCSNDGTSLCVTHLYIGHRTNQTKDERRKNMGRCVIAIRSITINV